MPVVQNTVTIVGPAVAVFDLVTSARFWPRWHPATRAVGGVTERPYQRGDVVRERAQFGDLVIPVTWRVAEHARPSRVLLQAEGSSARIAYGFQSDGAGVVFTRTLEYDETPLRNFADLGALRKLMDEQSEEGMRRLKELVEDLLRVEAAGLA